MYKPSFLSKVVLQGASCAQRASKESATLVFLFFPPTEFCQVTENKNRSRVPCYRALLRDGIAPSRWSRHITEQPLPPARTWPLDPGRRSTCSCCGQKSEKHVGFCRPKFPTSTPNTTNLARVTLPTKATRRRRFPIAATRARLRNGSRGTVGRCVSLSQRDGDKRRKNRFFCDLSRAAQSWLFSSANPLHHEDRQPNPS